MTINIIVINTINNKLFSIYTLASEFMTSKMSWHTKTYGVTKNHGLLLSIDDTLLPNDMSCHHHNED